MKFTLTFLCLLGIVASNFANGFIQNNGQITNQFGQINTKVLFVARTGNMQIQLRKNGYSYEYFQTNSQPDFSSDKTKLFRTDAIKINIDRIDIDFVNANPSASVETQQQQAICRYYSNGAAYTAIEFNKIIYRSIYPNIDIEFLLGTSANQFFKYNNQFSR